MKPVRIGVLAHNGPDAVVKRWSAIGKYLDREIPDHAFQIVPLAFDRIENAVAGEQVDFLFINPAEFIRFESNFGALSVLTVKRKLGNSATSVLGSVIFTRADRGEIRGLGDLRGRKFAAVDPTSYGGWLLARQKLESRQIVPATDFARLDFLGTHEAVIKAVRDGNFDAGTVRADLLSQLPPGMFRVLDPTDATAEYPLVHSTRLMPEWPLVRLKTTSAELSDRVAMALLKLTHEHPAAKAAEIEGWTTPLNYRPVREMLRDLRLPPYETNAHVTIGDAVRDYRSWILAAVAMGLVLIGAAIHIVRINRSHTRMRLNLETQLAEREKADRALKESESLYHSLVETLPQNIFRKGLDERFTFVNKRFCATVDKPREAILGRTDADLFPHEMAEKYRNDDQEVIKHGSHYETVEKHVTPDGDVRYVQVLKSPLVDSEGEIAGIQGIFWDVTGKKRAEEELARSEERFALAVRGSNDGLWDWNIEAEEIYYSPRFKELLGFPDHELSNHVSSHVSRIHPEDSARVLNKIRNHLKHRAPFDVEYRLLTRSGEYLWFHARGQAIWNSQGRATRMAGSLSDITLRKTSEVQLRDQNVRLQEMARSERRAHQELKQAQSRMVQTAKLAGLGEMVAGVAHEINNPLSFVSNNVCVLQRDLGEVVEVLAAYREADASLLEIRPDLHERIHQLWDHADLDYTIGNLPGLLNRTRDGLRRIQQIVKDLRVFARLDESDLNEVDLNAGMESTVNIVTGQAKKKSLTIDLDLQPLPLVTCYPAKINQVVMNLVSNAIDASHEGGTVSIHTGVEASGVYIEVEDHGTGIEPAVRDRIFDPFFTTKPVGVGTGLGLSISYGIVQDHGGTIEVDSNPGLGTRFTVHLPLRPLTKREGESPQTQAVSISTSETSSV